MTAAEGTVIAVDVGGTTIKGAVVDADGRFRRAIARPTPAAHGAGAVIAELQAVVAELAAVATAVGPGPRAVALVVPGIVDATAGRATFSANLGFRDVAVRDLIASAIGLPTLLEHDVRAAGVAERTVGFAASADDCLVVVIGTGIAGVIHAEGQPVRGARGIAGELGHIPVWPDGQPCPCGQRGCLERYASASAIVRRCVELGGAPVASAHEVVARRASDPAAGQAWREATDALAIAFATCTMLLDPEVIVLAGGLTAAGDALRVPVEAGLAARLTFRDPPPVRLSPLGGQAGLVGAAVLGWRLAGIHTFAAWSPDASKLV